MTFHNLRFKDYRTPPIVAPPQVPSNYAPNYPRADHPGTGASGTLTRQLSSSSGTAKQYGNLPSSQAQVQMVHPQMQPPGINSSHHYQPQDQTIDHLRGGGGGATMPRLSSGSLRSTGSHTSGDYIIILGLANLDYYKFKSNTKLLILSE